MTVENLTPSASLPHQQAKERFLTLFSLNRRSGATKLFLLPVRNQGITDLPAVVAAVLDHLQGRIDAPWSSELSRNRETATMRTIQQHPEEAEGFAAWAVSYCQLADDQRQKYKRAGAEAAVTAWLEKQPATERQVAYLRNLGHTGQVENKLQANRLIESLRGGGGSR